MRRRDFISLLGTTAAAWPFAARAQQPTMPAIGFLDSRSPEAVVSRLRALRQGLQESGYIEGENVAIVYRYAENQLERLSDLARDLVQRRVAVIVTPGEPSAFAAKAATPRSQSCLVPPTIQSKSGLWPALLDRAAI